MPDSNFLVIPEVSSERRIYIPLGFMTPEIICSNKLRIFRNATLYHFGVLSSFMHMAWTRYVTGRLKSDYQYSVSIVYNNFPWPQAQTDKQKQAIEDAAQAVLDARATVSELFPCRPLRPLTMPVALTKAHQKLDAAVDVRLCQAEIHRRQRPGSVPV
jgi:hypothetical protein